MPSVLEQQQHNARSRFLPLMEGIPSSAEAEAASLRRHASCVELYEKIQQFHTKNVDVATIARHVGVSRQTVYRYLQMKQAASAHTDPLHAQEAN